MALKVTVKNSIRINQPKEVVWAYTQNYDNRAKWDKSIKSSEVLQENPHRIVKVNSTGNINMIFEYKLEDRPNITSLALVSSSSKIIQGGGGSWKYESENNGTLWTQTNTVILKDNVLNKIIKPL